MNDFDRMSDPRDCGADVGAYVLGALDRGEDAAFRRHVAECVVCRDEVEALQAAAGVLPLAAPHLQAPSGLRRRALSRVRAEPRAPAADDGSGRVRLRVPRPAFAPPMSFASRRGVAAAGLLAAAAVTVGALQLSQGGADAVRTVHASVINQSRNASAVLHVGRGQAELVVSHMSAPPRGKIYEVWLERPGQAPEPTISLFSVTSGGAGEVDVPGNLAGVSEVRVTPEPLGGSRAPTLAPVIIAALPS